MRTPTDIYYDGVEPSSFLEALQVFVDLKLDIVRQEIQREVLHVLDPHKFGSPYFYNHQVHWLGWTAASWMKEWFIIPYEVVGFHECISFLFNLEDRPAERLLLGAEIQRIWQYVWPDELVSQYPSPYTTFIRDRILSTVQEKVGFPLQVRQSVIAIERQRNEDRLIKAVYTPKLINRGTLDRGVEFCWLDALGESSDGDDRLSTKERAAFVLTQLMMGSRFKGIAIDNIVLDSTWWSVKSLRLKGLSKSEDKEKQVTRPINLALAKTQQVTKALQFRLMKHVFNVSRNATKRIINLREAETKQEIRDTLNVMRKEVKRYIQIVFPGLLRKGESTHLLRKIYLQLAFAEYGGTMKETGFAAMVFGHESVATSLHYTSVSIID